MISSTVAPVALARPTMSMVPGWKSGSPMPPKKTVGRGEILATLPRIRSKVSSDILPSSVSQPWRIQVRRSMLQRLVGSTYSLARWVTGRWRRKLSFSSSRRALAPGVRPYASTTSAGTTSRPSPSTSAHKTSDVPIRQPHPL